MQAMIYMIHPLKKRFYWLFLQQDLFDTWCVRKVFGGLTNNHCYEMWVAYSSQDEAAKALADVEYLRRQRGYIYADIPHPEHYHLRPQNHAEIWVKSQIKSLILVANDSEDTFNHEDQQLLF